ncbi:MAG: pectate lyase [Verrucomicrobiota bacterium]|nr:pectate lyase [Verrucomicrobiota bacterium]
MIRFLFIIYFANSAFADSPANISSDLQSEIILLFQNADGGWPKNIKWDQFKTIKEATDNLEEFRKKSTIDNSATYTEIRVLNTSYNKTKNSTYRDAALSGLKFILREQRASGGWRGSDVDAITFNDNAMIGVMKLLKEITQNKSDFSWIEDTTRKKCRKALDKALRVVLDCQILVNGKKTAWCQQHHHFSLKPIKARTYELPSISGAESVEIIRYLMRIDQPSNEIIESIESAILWFRQSAINDLRVEKFAIEPVKHNNKIINHDIRIVTDLNAKPIWARFYEIKTNRPFFCNRDGIKVYSLNEVKLERRTGYSWYSSSPAKLLDQDYPKWKKNLNRWNQKN